LQFGKIHFVQLFAPVRVFSLRIIFPRDINVCKQVKVIIALFNQRQDLGADLSILKLAPNLYYIKVRVAKQDAVGGACKFVLYAKLAMRNGGQIVLVVGPDDVAEVTARVFRYPLRVVVGSQKLGKIRLTGTLGSNNYDAFDVLCGNSVHMGENLYYSGENKRKWQKCDAQPPATKRSTAPGFH